jgi:arylsulfatase
MFKHYIHEGGIASPFIVHWPSRLKDKGSIKKTPVQLPDIMATILDATDTDYPKTYQGNTIIPLEGVSMLPIFENTHFEKEYLFWEHEGNCGVRHGDWKLVKFHGEPWELYDKAKDGTELHDLADQFPDIVSHLDEQYEEWRKRTKVLTHEEYEQYSKNPGHKGQVVDIKVVKQFMAKK